MDLDIAYVIAAYGFLLACRTSCNGPAFASAIRRYSDHPRSLQVAEYLERSRAWFARKRDGTVIAYQFL